MYFKIILSLVFICFIFLSPSFAATVTLKNGDVLEGEIIEKTDTYLKLDIKSGIATYFLDETQDIQEGVTSSKEPDVNLTKKNNNVEFNLKLKKYDDYVMANDFENALFELENLQREYPDNPTVYFNLASMNYRLGDYQKALSFAKKAIELDPDNFSAYGIVSIIDYIDGRKEESEAAMQKAKEIALKIGKTDDSALQSAENELSRIKSLNE